MDQPAVVLAPIPRWPGILSFALAVLTVAGLVTGLVLVVQDRYLAATYAAWAATGVGAVAAVLGLIALVGRFGRGWAAAGLALAVVANPPVLTWVLGAIGRLWA
jgi:hypothetical protein